MTRIDPALGRSGDAVTIFGFGFSVVAEKNVVAIGSASTTATAYQLVDPPVDGEIESLTVTLPDDLPTGEQAIIVTVGEWTSNDDILFTVNP